MSNDICDAMAGDTFIKNTGDKMLYAGWMVGQWDAYANGYKMAADKLVRIVLPKIKTTKRSN
jgi:hypothetical protein